ncbi:hypothetical protein H4S08_004188 [Coemansia sp. RSA 1365]|nr:hypothetical protein H4S08_004188 [Coemansia sp. RSA 1365]
MPSGTKTKGTVLEYVTAEARIVGTYQMDDAERIFDFILGLKPKPQEYVCAQEPTSFWEVIQAAMKYECIQGGLTTTMDTPVESINPDAMDVDAVQMEKPAYTNTNNGDPTFTMAQIKEIIQIAAMSTPSNSGHNSHGPTHYQRRSQAPELTISITINDIPMQVSTCQQRVKQYLHDNRLCYHCESTEHISRNCTQGKGPSQQ